jgi:aspartate/glutamate racemase
LSEISDQKPESNYIIAAGAGPYSVGHGANQILRNTKIDKVDSCISMDAIFRDLPDRSKAILDPTSEVNPETCAKKMVQGISTKIDGVIMAQKNKDIVHENIKKFVIPVFCNTFHAPVIYQEYEKLIESLRKRTRLDIELINMPEVVTRFTTKHLFPDEDRKNVGVLCTNGSRKVGLYDTLFEEQGWQVTNLPDEMQNKLHGAIYNKFWGLKRNPNSSDASKIVWEAIIYLIKQEVRAVVFGCTEIKFGSTSSRINIQENTLNGNATHYQEVQVVRNMFMHGPLPQVAIRGGAPAALIDSSTFGARGAVKAAAPNNLKDIELSNKIFEIDEYKKSS